MEIREQTARMILQDGTPIGLKSSSVRGALKKLGGHVDDAIELYRAYAPWPGARVRPLELPDALEAEQAVDEQVVEEQAVEKQVVEQAEEADAVEADAVEAEVVQAEAAVPEGISIKEAAGSGAPADDEAARAEAANAEAGMVADGVPTAAVATHGGPWASSVIVVGGVAVEVIDLAGSDDESDVDPHPTHSANAANNTVIDLSSDEEAEGPPSPKAQRLV